MGMFKHLKKQMTRIAETCWLNPDEVAGIGIGSDGGDDHFIQVFVHQGSTCELPEQIGGVRVVVRTLDNARCARLNDDESFRHLKKTALRFMESQWQYPEDISGIGVARDEEGQPCIRVFVCAGHKSRYPREYAGATVRPFEVKD